MLLQSVARFCILKGNTVDGGLKVNELIISGRGGGQLKIKSCRGQLKFKSGGGCLLTHYQFHLQLIKGPPVTVQIQI